MTIFFNNIKRILKSKIQLTVLFILPLLPLIPICLDNFGSINTIKVGIVDNDRTNLTSTLQYILKSQFKIIDIQQKDINSSINEAKADFVISIPKGYTDKIINLQDVQIEGYANKDKNITPFMRRFIDGFINPVKNMAKISNKNTNMFYEGLKPLRENIIAESQKSKAKPVKKNSNSAWGMIIQFCMFSAIFASTTIIIDKENKTFFRTLSSPVSLRNYMFQIILSFCFIALLQLIILSSVAVFGFGIEAGKSLINVIAVLIAIDLVSVSFGIAVSSISRNVTKATMIGISLITVMCMIGGAWGMESSSKVIQNISKLVPVTWAMEAIEKLTDNKALGSMMQDISILLIFAVVFFLLGTWKKADIVK